MLRSSAERSVRAPLGRCREQSGGIGLASTDEGRPWKYDPECKQNSPAGNPLRQ